MIEQHYLDLLTVDGWMGQYWRMLPDYETQEATYEALERKHERAFGKRKYSDFHSFQNVMYRYQSKKRKKASK